MKAAALFCLASLTTAVPAAAFPAHVDRCHDGDTFTTETGVRIRLAEIDALEIDQRYGAAARNFLCSMVCGHEVDIEPRETSYGRDVGLIRVGGLDTSEAMVAAGGAWDYPQYDSDSAMAVLERRASTGRIGLWVDPDASPPWTWRHSRAGRFAP